ncbi:hypothetical protein GGI11_003402 [Coemansia sp. RSA 2049]|nr:hypothetical protein GGI11_003402 [Coemansia sp. RSA 2049]
MDTGGLRTSLLTYCRESGRTMMPDCRISEARQELVQRLDILRLQFARCHSAHECAKSYCDAGPLLSTMARSPVVASNAQLCRALVGAAIEYSKVLYLGVYSNQKASLWFSRLVESLLAIAECNSPVVDEYTRILQKHQIDVDGADGGRYMLRTTIQMLLMMRPLETESQRTLTGKDRDLVWQQTFSLCSNSSHPETLFEEIVDVIDDCGWRVLETHGIVEKHGIRLLTSLTITKSLTLWKRVERARAVLEKTYEVLTQRDRWFVRYYAAAKTQSERLLGQWRVAREARCQKQSDGKCVLAWLGAVALASDVLAFDILDDHFAGSCHIAPPVLTEKSGAGLTAQLQQEVVRREMALDVAAFLWAPLAGIGGRANAAAKDSVLREWIRRRPSRLSGEHH